jgi:cobalamin biosynthesis Mg chelatase CobN
MQHLTLHLPLSRCTSLLMQCVFCRGQEHGTARPEVLQSLLSTTQRVVQEVDSVEYGLTDIQEYYANTGALKRAAETAQGGKILISMHFCDSHIRC